MYLSTMAGALKPTELAMYSAVLLDSDNSEMIEFLMAGMWILLRNPENRRVRCAAMRVADWPGFNHHVCKYTCLLRNPEHRRVRCVASMCTNTRGDPVQANLLNAFDTSCDLAPTHAARGR